jgi:hypothetical protein
MKRLLRQTPMFLIGLAPAIRAQDGLPYTAYSSFSQVLERTNAHYAVVSSSIPRAVTCLG